MPSWVEIGPVVLEKTFLISSMYFRRFLIISPWKRAGLFIWTNLNSLHQGCFVPSLVEIGPVVLEKIFFTFVSVFSLFRNYLPFDKGGALHLNKLESPSPKDALCQVGMKLALWFWRRRFFLISSMYFHYFVSFLHIMIKHNVNFCKNEHTLYL